MRNLVLNIFQSKKIKLYGNVHCFINYSIIYSKYFEYFTFILYIMGKEAVPCKVKSQKIDLRYYIVIRYLPSNF